MKSICLLLISLSIFQDVPLKTKEEFEVKLDYQFKQRPAGEASQTLRFEQASDSKPVNSGSLLPFLILNIKVIKLNGATRVKISNNLERSGITKKIKSEEAIPIQIGFTDDVKDKVTANEYVLTFLDADRKEIDRIVMLIDGEGFFFVNGEKRGKF
jgi:hypothetical protein